MKEYLKTKEDVLAGVKSEQSGISSAEASSRLEKNGKNKLAEGKKDSLIKRFLSQLADPMIIILIVAAVISAEPQSAVRAKAMPMLSSLWWL